MPYPSLRASKSEYFQQLVFLDFSVLSAQCPVNRKPEAILGFFLSLAFNSERPI